MTLKKNQTDPSNKLHVLVQTCFMNAIFSIDVTTQCQVQTCFMNAIFSIDVTTQCQVLGQEINYSWLPNSDQYLMKLKLLVVFKRMLT